MEWLQQLFQAQIHRGRITFTQPPAPHRRKLKIEVIVTRLLTVVVGFQ